MTVRSEIQGIAWSLGHRDEEWEIKDGTSFLSPLADMVDASHAGKQIKLSCYSSTVLMSVAGQAVELRDDEGELLNRKTREAWAMKKDARSSEALRRCRGLHPAIGVMQDQPVNVARVVGVSERAPPRPSRPESSERKPVKDYNADSRRKHGREPPKTSPGCARRLMGALAWVVGAVSLGVTVWQWVG